MTLAIPHIDQRVHHVGVSKMRHMDAGWMRSMAADEVYVLREGNEPLAVLMTYDLFVQMSAAVQQLLKT